MVDDLKNLSNDDLLKYIDKLRKQLNNEKYGLYFDRKNSPEVNAENSKSKITILNSINELSDINGSIENILIEGDNFYALTALNMIDDDNGLVDIIYIDPPYNTGNKDFIYNDKIVDSEDTFRHTKWLNFIEKRLILAARLLKSTGLILISIDNNELAQIKLLCDSIFNEENFISILPRKTVEHIRTNSTYELQNIHDYVLVYSVSKYETVLSKKEIGTQEYPFKDNYGKYQLKPFQNSGENGTREARPNLYYPIYYSDKLKAFSLEKSAIYNTEILPKMVRNKDGRWLWSKDKFIKDNKFLEYKNNTIYRKSYYDENEDQTKYQAYKSWLDGFPNRNGTNELKNLGLLGRFDYPKPVELLKFLINLSPNKNSTVLDFFAGSGTTGQAVLELNKEDGGNRRFILCTNNENNIMTDVCYPRIKTVVTGVRPDGTKYSDGIPANVRYFKTAFIEDSISKDQAKYNLVEQVDSLLCISENVFDKFESGKSFTTYTNKNENKAISIFNDYYDEKTFDTMLDSLNKAKTLQNVVYYFSLDNNIDESIEKKVISKISNALVKPIPSKIYEIYKKIADDLRRDY